MDHMAHVHHWEEIGALIHAPKPESAYLLNLHKFYEGFGFYEKLDFTSIEKFAEKNKYHPCKTVVPFELGAFLKFENVIIETIPFTGHSKGHVGFFLPNEKLLHISCLGFDKQNPNSDGFGPWYGFEECSIAQYLKDIELAKVLFLQRAEFLTSSHAYIVKNPDITPFTYMRKKFDENQAKIDHAVLALEVNNLNEIDIDALLELDLFFPKKKMNGFMIDLYRYWESKIINKHLKRSKYTTIE
jgi:glyoxylase-like metal-dependent hydrolase (beta-lactamase superfamily II)